MSARSEGSACRCDSPAEHARLVARVNASFEKDPGRVAYALTVATSEQLRKRAEIHLLRSIVSNPPVTPA
jgi:hypothetical protein